MDCTATCLDQIISNIPNFVKQIDVLVPIANCDHCMVATKLLFRRKKDPSKTTFIYDYIRAYFEYFRWMLIETCWDHCFSYDDVESCCTAWSQTFLKWQKMCSKYNCTKYYCTKRRSSTVYVLNERLKGFTKGQQIPITHGFGHHFARCLTSTKKNWKKRSFDTMMTCASLLENQAQKTKPAWWRSVNHFLNRNHTSSIPSVLYFLRKQNNSWQPVKSWNL